MIGKPDMRDATIGIYIEEKYAAVVLEQRYNKATAFINKDLVIKECIRALEENGYTVVKSNKEES